MKTTRLLLSLSFCLPLLHAEIVYDNSANPEGKFNNSNLESGDQVTLAGEERILTEFAFEYFAAFAPTGDETARVRFYSNDGAELEGLREPGTLLYDSGSFSIASGYRTIRGSELELFIEADTFTWTVEFGGIAESESAGLLNYDPPTIGGSGDFFWQKETNVWQAVASSDTGNNFAARFIAELARAISRIQRADGSVSVVGHAKPGRAYALEFTRSLNNPQWARTASGAVRATTNEVTLQDTSASEDPMRFYRIVERTTTISRVNTQGTVVAASLAGRSYALETSTDFGTWTQLNTTNATAETVSFNVPLGDPFRFFRVIEL